MLKKNNHFSFDRRNGAGMGEAFINNDEVGLCVADFHTGQILFANPKMTFYAEKSNTTCGIGKFCTAGLKADGENACPFCSRKNLLDRDGEPSRPYVRELYLESSDIWLKVINQAVIWAGGRLLHMAVFYDITESKKMREQISRFMHRDRVLGLKNEASLERDVRDTAEKPTLILFHVTSLRKINAAYGRETGDRLLRVAREKILSQDIPDSELYRIGWNSFCLAVKNTGCNSFQALADEMSRLFAKPWAFERNGKRLWLFCTVSISVIPGKYIKESEPLLSMIDRLLERARGRRAVVVYDSKLDKAQKHRLKLEWSLKRCIHENMLGFEMHYQPIVDSISGIWCGLEALCRWNSPELGAVSPIEFIAEAERMELIGPLGLWVMETAVRQCKEWKLDCCDNFILNVNLSAIQFADESLGWKIIQLIEKYDYPGEKLCLEITESARIAFLEGSLQIIAQLRKHKVLIALDDFGTGYSSFSRLKNVPVDIVKIERVFTADIEHNEYHRRLFRAMSELAHMVDMKIVAEGVERKRQVDILVADGADYFQGYLFGKPLHPDDLESELRRFHEKIPSLLPENYFVRDNNEREAVI